MAENGFPAPARFSDRLNAFALDASLFASAYFLTAMAVVLVLGGREPPSDFYAVWAALWSVLFLSYHAYFGCDGRRTLGKRAFGLAVSTEEGGPVGFKTALMRAIGYLPSSLALNAGFLWALRKDGRAWHDLIAGTRVVEIAAKSPRRRKVSAFVGWALAAVFAAAWFGLVVIGPGLARMRLLAQARIGLKSLAYLEEQDRLRSGAYTADLAQLLGSTTEAAEIGRGIPFYVDRATIRLTAGPDSYSIEAEALDRERTLMRIEGPVPRPGAVPASGHE